MISEQPGKLRSRALPPRENSLQPAWLRLSVALVWSRGAPLLLLLAALLAALLAYQTPFHSTLDLATIPAPVLVRGAYPIERTADGGWQRWLRPEATLVVPGVGATTSGLRLRFFGGDLDAAGRVLTIRAGDMVLARAPVRPFWQEIRVALPPTALDPTSGDLRLHFAIAAFADDKRELGVSLGALELLGRAGPHLPPPGRALQLALVALLAFWTLRATGLAPPAALAAAGGLLLLLAGALTLTAGNTAAPRLQAALALDVLLRVLPLTLLLALALLALTAGWSWQRAPGWAVTLRCAVLLIFALRLAGLEHPQFVLIDHNLRVNQLVTIANGRPDLVLPGLEQQFEWGTREPIPYSLLTYYVLTPLVWVVPGEALRLSVSIVTVLIDASMPLLFWALLRGEPAHPGAAAWAGLCYAALPIGYLFFHDGSFPTTMGAWAALLALIGVKYLLVARPPALLPAPRPAEIARWALVVALLAAALVAYVTQIAFLSFLALALAASLRWLGASRLRRAAGPLLLALVAALFVDWLIYYRAYTVTLVQRTIPAFAELIATQGSVGRDPELFFGSPPKSVVEHAIAHFRVWPLLLAGVVLAALALHRRDRLLTHLGLAGAALLVATSVAEQWFGLWNKHMYFAAPLVALLAGCGLAWLWRRGAAGRVCALALLAYLFWESSIAWGNRVLWYLLPPNAL